MYDVYAVFFACAVFDGCVKHRKWGSATAIGTVMTYLLLRMALTTPNPWINPFELQHEYRDGNIEFKHYIGLHLFWICALSIIMLCLFLLFVKFLSLFVPIDAGAEGAGVDSEKDD